MRWALAIACVLSAAALLLRGSRRDPSPTLEPAAAIEDRNERTRAELAPPGPPNDGEPRRAPEQASPAVEGPEEATSTLHLTVRDAGSGAPLESRVDLWRLDLPEDAAWHAGDVLERGLTVPVAGLDVEALPAGTYRAVVHGQREKAEDPPAFEVRGPRTKQILHIEPPRTYNVRVRAVGLDGELLDSIRQSSGSFVESDPDTRWQDPRRPKVTDDGNFAHSFGFGATGGLYARRRGESETFQLGPFHERPRAGSWQSSLYVDAPHHGRASIDLPEVWEHDELVLLALLPERAAFAERVVTPSGAVADATVSVTSDAVVLDNTATYDAWRDTLLTVQITAEGFESTGYTHRVSDGEIPVFVLTPR